MTDLIKNKLIIQILRCGRKKLSFLHFCNISERLMSRGSGYELATPRHWSHYFYPWTGPPTLVSRSVSALKRSYDLKIILFVISENHSILAHPAVKQCPTFFIKFIIVKISVLSGWYFILWAHSLGYRFFYYF